MLSLGTPMFVDGGKAGGGELHNQRSSERPSAGTTVSRVSPTPALPTHILVTHFLSDLGHDDMEPDAAGTSAGGGEARKQSRDTFVELQKRGGAATATVPIPVVAQRKPSYCAKREAAEYKSRTKPKKGPQIFAAVSVSTGCLSYGICMAYTSSAIPSMMDSALHLSDSQASWMSSLLALGAMFGSLSAVFLMDAVGRKASLLAFSVMSLFIGWTMMMAASQPWQLYVGRFLLGLGAGLEITISPVYIHETTMRDMRDICGSFPQVYSATD